MRWLAVAVLLCGGCASRPVPPAPVPAPASAPPPAPAAAEPQLPHYRCDRDMEFDVRIGDGSVQLVFAGREPETLLRDAGGTSAQQTVFSSTRAKVEFGLEPQGRGAQLNLVDPPIETRCLRD